MARFSSEKQYYMAYRARSKMELCGPLLQNSKPNRKQKVGLVLHWNAPCGLGKMPRTAFQFSCQAESPPWLNPLPKSSEIPLPLCLTEVSSSMKSPELKYYVLLKISCSLPPPGQLEILCPFSPQPTVYREGTTILPHVKVCRSMLVCPHCGS